MPHPDRIARRQRRSRMGLWLLAALALVVVLLIAAALLKSVAARQRAALETEAFATATAEKSSTVSPTGTHARPLPVG